MPSSKETSNIFIVLISWALPMAWVAAIPMDNKASRPESPQTSSISIGKNTVEEYLKEHGIPPINLNAIRAYARIKNVDFVPWDEFGQRLDYLRLGPKQWFLRSFGADGQQNTLMTKQDPVSTSPVSELGRGVFHDYNNRIRRYNPSLLLGATSNQGNWHAAVYLDQISGASRLLVRHKVRKSFFMITDHDTVEEFYWLPDGYRIVFSATGSNRYKDGVYLWNLLTDKVRQIYPAKSIAGKSVIGSSSDFYHLSLAGIEESPPRLLIFAAPRTDHSLDPIEFFAKKNLVAIRIPENKDAIREDLSKINLEIRFPLRSGWTPRSDIANCSGNRSLQKEWCRLPTSGTFQSVLETWQKFAESAAGTPVFSYCLLQLTGLYSDSYGLLEEYRASNPDDPDAVRNAEILKSYGMEFALALTNQATAPSWMRSVGHYAYEHLGRNQPLPFRIANLALE